MSLAFSQTPFDERVDHNRLGVRNFLTRFDAIFTLNQHTLLEEHYLECFFTRTQGYGCGLRTPSSLCPQSRVVT